MLIKVTKYIVEVGFSNNKIITRWQNTEDYIEILKLTDDEITLYTNFSSDIKVHMVYNKKV